MADLIQIRRDKASVWQSVNPTLALAEIGIVLDNNGAMTDPVQFKVGDGSTAWNNLPLQNGSAINKIKVNGVEISIDGSRAVDVVVKASGSLGAGISGSNIAFVDTNGVVRNSSINVANTSGSSTSSLMTQAAVSESIADVRKDVTLLSGSVSGSFAAVDERVTNIEENIEDNYARIDGSYDSMAVGVAKNLEGNQEVEGAFISRTAGGDAEIANGVAQILEVRGNSVKWNSLWQTNPGTHAGVVTSESNNIVSITGSCTLTATDAMGISTIVIPTGHVGYMKFVCTEITGDYLLYLTGDWTNTQRIEGSFQRIIRPASSTKVRAVITLSPGKSYNLKGYWTVFDMTALGIDNLTTVEEVEAWLAENIGPLEYYPYNAGTVLNNSMEGIETIGFNLLDPATGKAQIIGAYDDVYDNLYGITGTHGAITFKGADGTEETVTPDADGKFQLLVPGELTVANPGADCAVFIWWDGTKTDYEEYDRNVSYLDVKNIYGKLNGSGSLVQVFPDGLAGVNSIKDVLYVEDGKVVADKLTNGVDLGTLSWTKAGATQAAPDGYFGASIGDGKISSLNVLCSRYQTAPGIGYYRDHIFINVSRQFAIVDINYNDASTFKTAMNGVRAVYELATPQHYTDLVYINSSHFADNTPVALPVTFTVDNWGIENILPKNTSESVSTAPADLLCKYTMDAVEMINTHSDQIEDLYEVKADKEGVYPGITAGNLVDVNGVGTEQQFMFRHTGGDEHVADKTQAALQKYMGKSLVWNQCVNAETSTFNECTITKNANGTYTVSGAGSVARYKTLTPNGFGAIGHKLLYRFHILSGSGVAVYDAGNLTPSGGYLSADKEMIYTQEALATWTLIRAANATDDGTFSFVIFDLTLMFGAGNEPSTVAEFEALFPKPYYAYNAGTIISNNADSIETVGFNQWDEVATETGYISDNGNVVTGYGDRFASTNLISVFPNTTYYIYCPAYSIGSYGIRIAWYDENGDLISVSNRYVNSIESPSNAHFMRFAVHTEYGSSTYNHDICINISDPTKNGTYEPYEKLTTQIGLGEFQVKDSEGNVITVNGLKSAGSVYDEIDPARKKYIKRVGVVDLGTLTWRNTNGSTSSGIRIYDASIDDKYVNQISSKQADLVCCKYVAASDSEVYNGTKSFSIADQYTTDKVMVYDPNHQESSGTSAFTSNVSGVILYYRLATPEEYDLVGSIPETYPAFGGGTEAIEPSGVDEETGIPLTAPFRAVIFYSKDYLGQLNNMPQDYISVGSMTNFYTELAAKLGAAISKSISVSASYNSSDQKYDYVITISDISGSV